MFQPPEKLAVGQPFNPFERFYGAWVPVWLMKRKPDEISAGAKLCYAHLMRCAGKKGRSFLYVADVGEALGVSERQAATYLQELKRLGLIANKRQMGRPNVYTFLWHAWAASEPQRPRRTSETAR
jgi:hypothetical protein